MTENEAVLLQRFSTGSDAEAFAELVRRYVQLVYSTSWRVLKDETDANDVTQETFFELTRQANRISGSLACWLHRVATQKSIDVIRRRVHRRQREQVYARTRPVEVQSWQDLSGHVDRALDKLDEHTRSLLLDHFIAGKTTATIAQEQGVSQATISRRINAALEQLRGILRRKGLLVTTVALGTLLMENAAEAVSVTVMGGLGKMAMVGTTRTVAATAAQAGAIKVGLVLVALIGTISAARYVHHARSSRPIMAPVLPARIDTSSSVSDEMSLPGLDTAVPYDAGEPPLTASDASGAEEPTLAEPSEWSDAALDQTVDAALAGPQETMELQVPPKVLHFPDDQSVGVVYVQDEGLVSPEIVHGFHPGYAYAEMENFSWARGDVTIPAGKRVILCIRGFGVTPERYLCTLASLEPNDLYGLQFFALEPVTFKDDWIEPIARLEGLRWLHLAGIRVSPKALASLSALPNLERLTTPLELSDRGMAEIAKMASLRVLNVARDELTDQGLKLIGRLTALESLDLCGNPTLTDAGLEELTNLRALRYMCLGRECAFTDQAMDTLAALPALKTLWLDTGHITDDGLRRLAQSRSVERLCIPCLSQISDRGLAHLRDMPQLTGLDIAYLTRLTDASLTHLAALENLEYLELPAGFTDAGVAKLVTLNCLRHLQIGVTGNSSLTDKSLAVIAQLPALEDLTIGGAEFTNAGIARLATAKGLQRLNLMWSDMDNETLKILATMPQLRSIVAGAFDGNITISGLNALNELDHLEQMTFYNVRRDDERLDLSNLKHLHGLRLGMWHEMVQKGDAFEMTGDTLRDCDLACLSGLTELEDLSLTGPGIGNAGLIHLEPLTKLKYLSLTGGASLTDEGLRRLGAMHRLDSLNIQDSRISEAGFRHLYPLKTLHVVRVRSTESVSGAAFLQIRTELPHLQALELGPLKSQGGTPERAVRTGTQRGRSRTTTRRTAGRTRWRR